MRRLILVVVGMVLVALPAVAQQQYGSVAGTIIDNTQQALPGVAVTLSGPAMQGSRAAVSDTEGRYRFVPVPPGGDYTLRFELQGFNTLERTGLTVSLGKEVKIDAEMSLSQFAETITVAADKIVIDTTKSTVDTNVDWKLADSLTTNRTFQTLMQLAPGVKANNNPFVNGASGDDNAYLIDGVDTTDPRTATWGTAINYDTIQEAQVQTAAFAAEYGRATGGVVNLITKSGGNKFSFTARVVKQDADWSASPGVESETGRDKTAQIATNELRPNATLGGPIVRDKLWFYTAYEQRDREQTFGRYETVDDAIEGLATQGTSTYEGHYISGKLTFQANRSHAFVVFYNEDPIDISNVGARYDYGPSIAQSAEYTQFQGGNNWSAQWYGVLSPDFFMEVKLQKHDQELNQGAQDPAAWGQQPAIYDWTWDYTYGGPLSLYQSERPRDGALLTGSYFLDSANGSHQLKGGIEYLKLKPTVGSIYNPAGYYYVEDGVPWQRRYYLDWESATPNEDEYWSVFVQDAWRIGKLTLNLGLRAESFKAFTNVGEEVVSFGFGDQLAPRLGFAYDLNGDSLRGSLGRFYDLPNDYIGSTLSSTTNRRQRWTWNASCAYDPATPVQSYPDACWDLDYDLPVGQSGYAVDPDLKPIYLDEFTFGYDKLLSDQFAAGATFVWREQKRSIEDVDPEYDGVYLWTNGPMKSVTLADDTVVETDHKWREYQALQFSLRKRLGPDGFQFIANYTYVLKSKGWSGSRNYSQFSTYGDDPDLFNPLWYGDQESPHEVKFAGSWTAPWKMIVGINTYWNSGFVYTRYDPINGSYNNLPLESAGSSEVGDNWEADLHIEQPVAIGPLSLALYVDLWNAFNNQQPTSRSGNEQSSLYNKPTGWQSPRAVQVGFKIEY